MSEDVDEQLWIAEDSYESRDMVVGRLLRGHPRRRLLEGQEALDRIYDPEIHWPDDAIKTEAIIVNKFQQSGCGIEMRFRYRQLSLGVRGLSAYC